MTTTEAVNIDWQALIRVDGGYRLECQTCPPSKCCHKLMARIEPTRIVIERDGHGAAIPLRS